MLEAALQACACVEGVTKKGYFKDKRMQQAAIFNLILIGEEATRLLKDDVAFAERYPQVPWRRLKGMRNRIARYDNS